MVHLLLAVIYLSFISLGLPDALLGAAWPSIYGPFGVPVSYAGIISMIIALGTVISRLLSDRLTRCLGTGRVTAVSVGLTAAALLGFSLSGSFWMLCLWAVPYGLGAGSVDASLNNYVALHYASRHMSWLHCMWGIGASAGPYIMGLTILAVGTVVLLLPLGTNAALVGLLLAGLGCAPVYPCLIHATPVHFGAERSQAVIGIQMASAYVGTCLMPPLFGMVANHISVGLFPVYLAVLLTMMAVMHRGLLQKAAGRP